MSVISHVTTLQYTTRSWAQLYKLPQEIMSYLWERIEEGKQENRSHKHNLAGNIYSSLTLQDPKNVMLNDILPQALDGPNRHLYLSLIASPTQSRELSGFWVNFQRKTEFNPLHSHSGTFSFVIWMQVPYSWENESAQPLVKESNTHNAVGNFMFVYADGDGVAANQIAMNPGMVGHIAIFPSYLQHIVYPFYTSDEERISISGNIGFI